MGDEFGPLSYEALHNQAYEQIRAAIRAGRFKPGETLRTRTLAKAMGVSSTPVREALARLIAQNALEVSPTSRTAIVPRFTRSLLSDLYEVRMLLEPHAAAQAARRIDQAQLAAVRKLAAEMDEREVGPSRRDERFLALSEKFHFSIYAASANPILVELIDSVWLRSSAILSLLHRAEPKDYSLRGHRAEMVAALDKHDAAVAAGAMNAMLAASRDMVFAAMETEETPPPSRRRKARPSAG